MIDKYKIEVIEGEEFSIPVITIRVSNNNEKIAEILDAIDRILNGEVRRITGYEDRKAKLIDIENIFRIRTEGRKVVIDTKDSTYTIRHSLKEIEEQINVNEFCRISQSEIINLNKVDHFDFSISGMISVEFVNGTISYVSRRQMKEVRKRIGKMGESK